MRHRLPWELTPAQEELKQKMIAAAEPLRVLERQFKIGTPAWRRHRDQAYMLGVLVQPAHSIEGGTLHIPERRYAVDYAPGYGVICPSLCTSNGSATDQHI